MPLPQPGIDKKLLQRGYWIATHRLAIKKWTSIALYALITFVYLFFFLQFGMYMFRYSEWQQLVAESSRPLYNWQRISAESAPLPVDLGTPILLSLGDGRYDIAVEAYNPHHK